MKDHRVVPLQKLSWNWTIQITPIFIYKVLVKQEVTLTFDIKEGPKGKPFKALRALGLTE